MKYVKWCLIVIYIYFILTKTIFGRLPQLEPVFKGLFWELREGYWNDIIMNILLFIPLGFLICGWKGVVVGFILSCSIEMIQYFGRLGFCELDDVLNNMIGTGVGVMIRVLSHKCYSAIIGKSTHDYCMERDL